MTTAYVTTALNSSRASHRVEPSFQKSYPIDQQYIELDILNKSENPTQKLSDREIFSLFQQDFDARYGDAIQGLLNSY